MKAPRKSGRSRTAARSPSALGLYLLLLVGARGKPVFADDGDRRTLETLLGRRVLNSTLRVHAYCWLGNEIQVLAEAGSSDPERLILDIGAEYASAVRGRLGRTSKLFSSTQTCYAPQSNEEVIDVVRMMHLRPVLLDVAEDESSYPWSSYGVYHGLKQVPWLTTERIGPLLAEGRQRPASATHTAPGFIAETIEAKLAREADERSRLWMARALVASIATQNGIASLGAVAMRLGVDATALQHAIGKYRERDPGLFNSPLEEVLRWGGLETHSPKATTRLQTVLRSMVERPESRSSHASEPEAD